MLLYLKWPQAMRVAMLFDAANILLQSYLPYNMLMNVQSLQNQIVIDFFINYCGDLWV